MNLVDELTWSGGGHDAASRRDQILEGLARWVVSPPSRALLKEFLGHSLPSVWDDPSTTAEQRVAALDEIDDWRTMMTAWDLRYPSERQAARDGEFNEAQRTRVLELADALGLRTAQPPRSPDGTTPHFDAICVLGGARLAPEMRARRVRELLDNGEATTSRILLLGTGRRVSEAEATTSGYYAPGAQDEVDLLCSTAWRFAAEPARAHDEWRFSANRELPPEITVCPDNGSDEPRGRVLRFPTAPGDPELYALTTAAPPDAERANTGDTLRHAQKLFGLGDGASILLVTSQTYVPYQQIEAMRALTIPFAIRVETIGNPREWTLGDVPLPPNFQSPSNYLQEVRSAYQASLRIADPRPGDL